VASHLAKVAKQRSATPPVLNPANRAKGKGSRDRDGKVWGLVVGDTICKTVLGLEQER